MNRTLSIAALMFALAALNVAGGPAQAQEDHQPFDVQVVSASVTGPGLDAPRRMDAEHAQAFVRSWFGPTLLGKPLMEVPPESAPVYRVEIQMVDTNGGTNTMLVDYAAETDVAWIQLLPQNFGWGEITSPTWIRAPEGTVAAFDGRLDEAPFEQRPAPNSTRSIDWPLVAGTGALIGLAAAGLYALVRLRRPVPHG